MRPYGTLEELWKAVPEYQVEESTPGGRVCPEELRLAWL